MSSFSNVLMNHCYHNLLRMKKVFIFLALLLLGFVLIFILIFLYPNSRNKIPVTVHIPHGATCQQLLDSLDEADLLKSEFTFHIASNLMFYKTILPGKYIINPDENNLNLVLKFRKGQHYPVKFTFNNIRTKEKLIEKVGDNFLFSPQELYVLLNDKNFLAKYNLTPENAIAVFIPDSYEFYYDISAEDFFNKIYFYYEKFWNTERRERANSTGLSQIDVVTLASIVEEENHHESEKSIIAGLYINRLNTKMKLEADPTVKFALGDFTLKRILLKHLNVDSPYNTYKYYGLPPGPIRIPEKSTVDSVLNYSRHSYIYMCAKEDFSGFHYFAKTANQHRKNAEKYHKALNKIEKAL